MARDRASIIAALFAVLVAAGTWLEPASASPGIRIRNGRTQPTFSYAQAIRETVYVQTTIDSDADGRLDLLATDIIRPRESNAGLRVPVIFEQSPYYQAAGRGNESQVKEPEDGDFTPPFFPLFYDNYFVPRGYAVVLQDMLGTRNSEGCMVLGGREEVLAAKATVDWLSGRGRAFRADGAPVRAIWSNGSVGMIGKSYDGTIANAVAALGVSGLKTIVPISAISRWYDYHLNNGVQYANAYATPAVFVIDPTPADDRARGLDWARATLGREVTCDPTDVLVEAGAADPRANFSSFYDDRDYLKDVAKVRASVFVVHGLNDLNVKPNNFVQWWQGLARSRVPRKIWLSETGHVDPFDYRRAEWVDTLHRWFDHWLYGIDNDIMREPQADIERAPGRWTRYRTWPDATARTVPLYAGPAARSDPGTMSKRRVGQPASQTFTDDPTQGEVDLVRGEHEANPARLLFLTPALAKDARISGPIAVRVRATVDRVDTDLTALLVDYGEGRPIRRDDYLGSGEGIRTLRTRSCWGASTPQDSACYLNTKEVPVEVPFEIVTRGLLDAKHHQSLGANTLLTPGRTYDFTWELWGDDWVFEAGHRIGLVIAGSDTSIALPDLNRATVTVQLQGTRLDLPIVGGSSALRFRG